MFSFNQFTWWCLLPFLLLQKMGFFMVSVFFSINLVVLWTTNKWVSSQCCALSGLMSEHSMQFVSVAKLHSLLEVNVFGYEIMLTCVSEPTTWSLVSCNHQKQKKCVGVQGKVRPIVHLATSLLLFFFFFFSSFWQWICSCHCGDGGQGDFGETKFLFKLILRETLQTSYISLLLFLCKI